MGKKATSTDSGVNKSQAIREYLATHAEAEPRSVVEALAETGIVVTPGLVGLVKFQARRSSAGAKPAKKTAAKPNLDPVRRKAGASSKSDAVRRYLAGHPDASPNTVREALAAEGIGISTSLAASLKYSKQGGRKSGPRGTRAGRPRALRAQAVPALDFDALVDAKRLAERMGGIDAAREALSILAKLA